MQLYKVFRKYDNKIHSVFFNDVTYEPGVVYDTPELKDPCSDTVKDVFEKERESGNNGPIIGVFGYQCCTSTESLIGHTAMYLQLLDECGILGDDEEVLFGVVDTLDGEVVTQDDCAATTKFQILRFFTEDEMTELMSDTDTMGFAHDIYNAYMDGMDEEDEEFEEFDFTEPDSEEM